MDGMALPGPLAETGRETLDLEALTRLEKQVLWHAAWMVHNANHLREKRDGVKVGGHQASSASVSAIMTALYITALRPQDRVAVKPHASPILHAIEYLLGRQSREALEKFRALGGAQSYPSRTKDAIEVDFSTGSVGLGAAMTNFSALIQDYVTNKGWGDAAAAGTQPGRMVAVVGDAELDEGNVYEALLETWKHDIRNCWWIIDYNRQSLDSVINDDLFRLIGRTFRAFGWNVITLKYGRRQRDAFALPGGRRLRRWIAECPNGRYSALTFKGGAAWREALTGDFAGDDDALSLVARYDDRQLADLMTNLAGHCLETLMEAFTTVPDDRPTCFIAYTVKGMGLPIAGHKDNHAGLLNPDQMDAFRQSLDIAEGTEWEPFAGIDGAMAPRIQALLDNVAYVKGGPRKRTAPDVPVPATPIAYRQGAKGSTQEAFGNILDAIAKTGGPLADRIVTTSPDVTVSTNLGAWVNRRGLYHRDVVEDVFRENKVASMQKWQRTPDGQHIELGIAENNLFLMLAAAGLSHSLFGERLLPIGTLYDPFIARGLDALNYACYQESRFILVATPSGLTLAPEGGAHQSVSSPLIGMGQPGLLSYEPAYGAELEIVLRHAFDLLQRPDGCSIYLRLSTRPIAQPDRPLWPDEAAVMDGAYWASLPPGDAPLDAVVAYQGVLAPEATAAVEALGAKGHRVGLLAVTSADRLHRAWKADRQAAPIRHLLSRLPAGRPMITGIDGHPATLAWLGGVIGHPVEALGVDRFGQCGDTIDLYREYGLDTPSFLAAAERMGL